MPKRFRHLSAPLQYIRIPKTADAKAIGFKPGVAAPIARVLRMLRAVGLDNEPRLEADEIRDVITNGNLPAEFEAGKPPVAKKPP
jgi:hypothetical protein